MKNRRIVPSFVLPSCSLPFVLSIRLGTVSKWLQPGPGWQVMKADWGAGNRWMDVTNQVRRLLIGQRSSHGEQHATWEAIRLYGAYKTLRIQATNLPRRSRNNSPSRKTIRSMPASSTTMRGVSGYPAESRVIPPPGSRLSEAGWRGNGSLQIIRAYYGLNNRTNDVTRMLLRGMVRNGTLVVQVNNNNMGGDPAKALTKCSPSSIAPRGGSKPPRSKRATCSEFREA